MLVGTVQCLATEFPWQGLAGHGDFFLFNLEHRAKKNEWYLPPPVEEVSKDYAANCDVRSLRSREVSLGSNIAQRVCKIEIGVGSDLDWKKQHHLAFNHILGKVEGSM